MTIASGTTIDIRARGGAAALAKDVVARFVDADGSSHARALAYQFVFVMLSGFVGLVGLASVLGIEQLRTTVQSMAETFSPGPSGRLLQEAARQGTKGAATAALFGLGAALGAGTLAMAQIQRSANRILGDDDDGGWRERYARAAVLALSAGLLLALGGMILVGGQALSRGFGWAGSASDVWNVVRWPIGIAIVAVGLFLLFRRAPRADVEDARARLAGAGVAVALWVIFSVLLAVYFAVGDASSTYGPLVAVIALLLFAGATSLALHLGFAVTAALIGAGGGTVGVAEHVAPDGSELPRR